MTTTRKPPPNPWPELRAARARIDQLNTLVNELITERDKLERSVNVMAGRERLYREINSAASALVTALDNRTFFNRNREAVDASRARLRKAYDAMFEYDNKNAPPVPHGNIAGLRSINA